jgi:hypothetical protein
MALESMVLVLLVVGCGTGGTHAVDAGRSSPGGTGGAGGEAPGGTVGAGGGGGIGVPEPDAALPADGPVADGPAPSADAAPVDTAAPVGDAGPMPWSALTAGWTQKPFDFALHTPYDLDVSARHSFDAATNTHTFWVMRGDKPHEPPPNATAARSELRMRNDYTSGTHQFEADVYVVAGTNDASVMQIFGGVTHATSIMFKAFPDNGGSVKRYDGPELVKGMAYDRWWHLNVIHEANPSGIGKIKVYADGQFIGTFDDRGNATHYFKCGVYGNAGARAESRFRNIKYWVK